MSLGRVSVRAVTPEIGARPGDITECTVRVRNEGTSAIPLFVRVHGLGQSSPYVPIAGPPLAPGAEVDVEVPLEVPETFGFGAHSLAIEIGGGKPDDRSALAKVVLTIGAPAGIKARIEPSVVRGGRRTRFDVEVHNSSTTRADVTLLASAPDVRVTLAQRQIAVDPGTTAIVRAKVRGPRRWVGDPAQHVLTVEARSGSVPIYSTASYRQRALLPRRARGGMIGVAFIVLWALIAAAVVLVWTGRDDDSNDAATEEVANGNSLPPLTNPDGSPATGGAGADDSAGGGGDGAGGAGDAADGSTAVTDTIVRGTVKAGETGADDGVLITLTPTLPGESPQVATASGSTSGPTSGDQPAAVLQPGGPGDGMRIVRADLPATSESGPPAKFWPDRYGTYRPGGLDNVRTLSVASVASGADGSWQFQEVPLRQSYEVSFAKPGYTTQSFIVSPPEDGEPVELEVELEPGDGALAGTVTGPPGAAEVTITDGTLTFTTTTSTDASTHGRWAVGTLSTPGTYTVTVESHGFGTEVMQVHLDAGQERSGLNIGLTDNVGSISGTVTAGGVVRGGVTVVATAGDEEITTTSLTEGDTGTFTFPQMALGDTYTVTASADGYVTQTRSVTVDGNTTGVDFALVKATASIIGRVVSSREGTTMPLVSAAVSVAAGELQVRTSSAAAPDAGAFTVTDLPPGSYVLAASRYDHPEASQLVTLSAGQVFDAGDIVLTYQVRPPLTATGSLIVRTVDSFGAELPGATVQLIDVGGTIPTQSRTMAPTESAVSFTAIPIGTYSVRVSKANYRPATINQLSIGLGAVERQVTMLQYGTARGTVIDAVAGYTTVDPVYVTADDPSVPIVFDQNDPLLLPPEAQIGPNGVTAFRTTSPAPAGRLVILYSDGSLVYDTNDDGVPDQPLTQVRIGNRQLSGYELLLYRMNGANPVCIGPIPESDSEWEIDPTMELLDGVYVLRFAPLDGEGAGTACTGRGQPPAGYATIPTDAAGNVATFTVADDLDRKILLGPIQVAPYTQVSGRVLVPRIDGGGNLVFDDFAAAQANGLAIELDCDAAASTVDATIAPGPGTAIAFTITREQIQALLGATPYDPTTGVIGACRLRAMYEATSEFIPTEVRVSVAVGLAPPSYPDRTVSVALVDDPGIITGTVWWRDLGATGAEQPTHPVSGATVASADDRVIVDFTPAVEDDPNNPDESVAPTVNPTDERAAVSTTADGGGTFVFATPGQRQVLDTSTYNVGGMGANSRPFTAQTLQITAEPGEWSALEVADAVVDNGSSVDVFLQPPAGRIDGNVSIVTNRTARPYAELQLTSTAPGATPVGPTTPVTTAGTYRIDPAAAGTWQLAWEHAPGSNLLVTSPNPSRPFVDAGQFTVAPPVTAVELAQIDVALTDDIGNPIDGNPDPGETSDDSAITVVRAPGPVTQPPSYPDTRVIAGTDGRASFQRLPVSAGNPLAEQVTYLVSAVVPKHDEPTSTVLVEWIDVDAVGGPAVIRTEQHTATMTNIPVAVRAGERVRVTVAVPAYARIEGRLTGLTTPPLYAGPATEEALVVGGGVQIFAIRSNGQQIPAEPADADGDGTPDTDGGFVIDVPAGTYSITFAAPNYVPPPAPIPLGLLLPDTTTTPAQNANLNQQLRLQTGTYDITAVAGTAVGAAPVENATVQLWWGDVNPLALPGTGTVHAEPTLDTGRLVLPAVYPGDYTLIVRKQGPDGDEHFPVIAGITIPRSPAPVGITTTHRVAMPPVGGSITGTIRAVAQNNSRPVALPVLAGPDQLDVTRSYDLDQLDGPGVLDNEATEANIQPTPPPTVLPIAETTAGAGTSYTFNRLAYGDHVLTFRPAPGFVIQPASPATIPVDGAETHPVTYRALNVTVDVTVTDTETLGPVEGATVTLVPTESGQSAPGLPSFVDGVYRFSGVAPDLADYTLHVEAEGYQDAADQLITVAPSGVTQNESADLTPVAIITGTAQTQGAAGTDPYQGEVELLDSLGAVVDTVDSSATGAFAFEVLPAGAGAAYTVRLRVAGHEPDEIDIDAGDLTLTETLPIGTLTALQHATATITVSTTPVPDGLTLAVSPIDGVTGAGISTTGSWSLTGLRPGTTYSFDITSEDYEDDDAPDYAATPGGSYTPSAVALVPRPATATISVTNDPAPDGLSLAVTSSVVGDVVDGAGVSTDGTWNLTGLEAGATYNFEITSDDYETATVAAYTATANGSYTPGAVTLTPKPATLNVSVTNTAPTPANLSLAVSPDSAAIGGDGISTDGTWEVTGLTAGTEYTITITSTDFENATFVHTPDANGTFTQPAITLVGRPARATITVAGSAGTHTNGNVTCSSGIIGVRGTGANLNIWTFSIPVGQSCTFTASAPGHTDASTATAYTATANGTYAVTLTPTQP